MSDRGCDAGGGGGGGDSGGGCCDADTAATGADHCDSGADHHLSEVRITSHGVEEALVTTSSTCPDQSYSVHDTDAGKTTGPKCGRTACLVCGVMGVVLLIGVILLVSLRGED